MTDFANGMYRITNEDDGEEYLVRPCPYRHEERYSWESNDLLPNRPPEITERNAIWGLWYYCVECPECHAKSPEYTKRDGGIEKAVEQWNSIPRPFDNDTDLIVAVDIPLLETQIEILGRAKNKIAQDEYLATAELLGGLENLLSKVHALLEEHDEVILQSGTLGY